MAEPRDPFKEEYEALSYKRHVKMLVGASGVAVTLKKVSRSKRLLNGVRRKVSTQLSEWKLAWSEFSRTKGAFWMKSGVGLVAFVFLTVLGGSIYGAAKLLFPFLPIYGWALTFAATTILAQMFVIHYSGIAHERNTREMRDGLEDRIWQLEDRLYPVLKIDYRPDDGEPFVQRGIDYTQYRVSVRSPVQVKTELVVNRVEISHVGKLFDVHLRPMHERDLSGTKRVELHADAEMYWDLVSVLKGEDGRSAVVLNCIPVLGFMEFDPGEHQFELNGERWRQTWAYQGCYASG